MAQSHTPIATAGYDGVAGGGVIENVASAYVANSSKQFTENFGQGTGMIRGIRVSAISPFSGVATLSFKVTSDAAGLLTILGEVTTGPILLAQGGSIASAWVDLATPFKVDTTAEAPYLWSRTDAGTCEIAGVEFMYEKAT